MKFQLLLIFALMKGYSFSQSSSDSLYIQNIIQSEIRLRYKKARKAIPVFGQALISENGFKSDSLFREFPFGKQIHWKEFPIQSEHASFVSNENTDSCLYIYAPVFNAAKDQFVIRFETRSPEAVSYFTSDYYYLKNRKWRFKKSILGVSF